MTPDQLRQIRQEQGGEGVKLTPAQVEEILNNLHQLSEIQVDAFRLYDGIEHGSTDTDDLLRFIRSLSEP